MDFSSNCSEISDYSEYRFELDALVQGTDDQWLYADTFPTTTPQSSSINIIETSPGMWSFYHDDNESVGSLYDFDTFTDEKLFGVDVTGFDKTLLDLELKSELETVELLKPLELESDSFTLPDEVQVYLTNCNSVIEQGEQSGLSPDEINFMLFSNLSPPSTSQCITSSPTKVFEVPIPEKSSNKMIPSYSTLPRASTSRPVTVVKSHQKSKSLFIKPISHEFVSKIPQFKASTPSLCSSVTSSTTSSRRSTIFSPPIPSPSGSPISFDNACKYPSLSRNSLQALSKGSQKFPSRIPRLSKPIDLSPLDTTKILKHCSINPLSWQTPAQPLVDIHRPLVNRSSLPASHCNLNWRAQLFQYHHDI